MRAISIAALLTAACSEPATCADPRGELYQLSAEAACGAQAVSITARLDDPTPGCVVVRNDFTADSCGWSIVEDCGNTTVVTDVVIDPSGAFDGVQTVGSCAIPISGKPL